VTSLKKEGGLGAADTYDAMNSGRPYWKAMYNERCIKEIHANTGRQFDPERMGIFLELAGSIG